MSEQTSIVVDLYWLPCHVWSTELCFVFCIFLSIKSLAYFFLWLNYIVNRGFVVLDEEGTKPISCMLLSYASNSLHLLKLYSPEVVLDICSCFDTSVYFYTAWLFRNWEGIASTLIATVVDSEADTVNSSCLYASAVALSMSWVLCNLGFLLFGAEVRCPCLHFQRLSSVLTCKAESVKIVLVCPSWRIWHGLQSAGRCLCLSMCSVSWIHSYFATRRIFVLLCSPLLQDHLDQASPLVLLGSQKHSCSYVVLLSLQRYWRGPCPPMAALRPLWGSLDLITSYV